MKIYFRLFLFSFLLQISVMSCTDQKNELTLKRERAERFVKLLEKNDQQGVYEISYHVDYRSEITDEGHRKMMVNAAHTLIKRYGLPPMDRWLIQKTQEREIGGYFVTIPLFSGFDSVHRVKKASIVIQFPPEQISDKVYHFRVDTEVEPSLPIQPVFDTTRG
ncbi:MAG: hypothetical protein EOO46_20435 [Flavobacterium sp.]|nr:MAG: hypothetical protein EOO46_20435 [Flavobacterium sp.]